MSTTQLIGGPVTVTVSQSPIGIINRLHDKAQPERTEYVHFGRLNMYQYISAINKGRAESLRDRIGTK